MRISVMAGKAQASLFGVALAAGCVLVALSPSAALASQDEGVIVGDVVESESIEVVENALNGEEGEGVGATPVEDPQEGGAPAEGAQEQGAVTEPEGGTNVAPADDALVESGTGQDDSAGTGQDGSTGAGQGDSAETGQAAAAAAQEEAAAQASLQSNAARQGRWVCEDRGTGHGFQRYWVWSDGTTAKSVLITPENGAGYYAYATSAGYVVRGAYDAGNGHVYLADNDGRLEEASGWLVTGKYTGGALQRYYLDPGWHAARTSYFYVDGYGACYGIGGVGYVLRGAGEGFDSTSTWSALYADNDGRLCVSRWLCTDAFGQGFQRYWFGKTGAMARGRAVAASEGSGYGAYATSAGYVLRGKLDTGCGRVYVADNDGRLLSGKGWVVTAAYDGALQRYYVVDYMGVTAAASGGFQVGGSHYFGRANEGYVLRGKLRWGAGMLLADNDGVMAWNEGWLVTGAYDGGELQRYRIDDAPGSGLRGAHIGSFKLGSNSYYGREDEGYVVRGAYTTPSGDVIVADNDGVRYIFLQGVDISSYQDGIDLAGLGVDFVIVKATQGAWYTFQSMTHYADRALSLGLKLGLYHFIEAGSDPVAQADYFVSAVGNYIGKAALILDWENTGGSNALAEGPSFAKKFLDRVYSLTGVKPLIYMSRSVVHGYSWSSVADAGYKLWVAQYPYAYYDASNGTSPVSAPQMISYNGHSSSDMGAWGSKPTIWQYTSTGRLPGWGSNLDLDVFYGYGTDWDALCRRQ